MKFVHVIEADNFTEMYKKLQQDLSETGTKTNPRKMPTRELINVNLVLTNPRERLLYSKVRKHNYTYASAEFLWYMAGTNQLDFIAHYLPNIADYSDDGKTVNSAYGYRIFGNHNHFPNQWSNVINVLRRDIESRQAVITIHYQQDIGKITKDVPCTMNLHFMIRDNKLDFLVQMRSNDAYMGLIYDVFSFTLLQEHMLNCLHAADLDLFGKLELGTYVHKSDSMHLYERNLEGVNYLLREKISTLKDIILPKTELFLSFNGLRTLQVAEQSLRKYGVRIDSDLHNGICRFMAIKLNKILEKKNA